MDALSRAFFNDVSLSGRDPTPLMEAMCKSAVSTAALPFSKDSYDILRLLPHDLPATSTSTPARVAVYVLSSAWCDSVVRIVLAARASSKRWRYAVRIYAPDQISADAAEELTISVAELLGLPAPPADVVSYHVVKPRLDAYLAIRDTYARILSADYADLDHKLTAAKVCKQVPAADQPSYGVLGLGDKQATESVEIAVAECVASETALLTLVVTKSLVKGLQNVPTIKNEHKNAGGCLVLATQWADELAFILAFLRMLWE
ncbi:hypothetical protein H9P43_000207 [Blastocladiella emersonii ATCC 22665]|nr:hypothetical protein H9P43_000207 [Blastocladiella emersonii ATCC 22665]